jgi:chromosome segregation ATPase
VAIYISEAIRVADFIDTYWEPSVDGARPGLVSVSEFLPKKIGEEIRSLAMACQYIQSQAMFAKGSSPKKKQHIERGALVVERLSRALEFILEDDLEEPADEILRIAKARYAENASQAQLAQSLSDFAALAESLKERLAKLQGFNLALIEEAKELAAQVVKEAAQPGVQASQDIQLRDRLLTLLAKRLASVRRAVRYVFEDHPDIIRLVTSVYQRHRRLAAKRLKKNQPNADFQPKEKEGVQPL